MQTTVTDSETRTAQQDDNALFELGARLAAVEADPRTGAPGGPPASGGRRVMTCTCGNPDDHVIARRVTADGKHVLAWDDGTLTWALGYAIRGSASPRTPEGRERARRAAWLVLDDVCLFDADEVPALIRAARWAAER